MSIYPDYGLFLLGQGYTREVRHSFYDFPVDHITVIGQGQFTTMKNMVFDGVEYAISLDFDSRILADILSLSPPSIANCVRAKISLDPISSQLIQIPQTLALGVEATLGQLQRGLHDEFVPFVIARVFRVQVLEGAQLELNQVPAGEMNPLPTTLAVDERAPFIHVVARRSEVERGMIEPTLTALQCLSSDPETALRYKSNATLSFQGYDQDPRGLFEIEEVREFVEKLNAKWYSWFFFMTKDIRVSPLAVITLCLCRYTRSPFGLYIPVMEDSKRFFWYHFGALRAVCKIHNLSSEQTETAVNEVIDYSMKVGFVTGCDTPQLAVDSAKTSTILRCMGWKSEGA
jgi:hypothetical protein